MIARCYFTGEVQTDKEQSST